MKGTITRIQRFSTTNGPGLRTTVFLKGCPLRCRWCHNPETQKRKRELLFYEAQCVKCGICVRTCPNGAHRLEVRRADADTDPAGETERIHFLDREKCVLCGACADHCPVEALEMTGMEIEADDVALRLLRDRAFYKNSGGGVTLSGGEPLFQLDFTREILKRCKEEGLHTCLDTSGYGIPEEEIRCLVRDGIVDLFLYDLKETNEERHLAATGVPLAPVLRNLEEAGAAGGRIRLRCPIIPGVNDREEHLGKIGEIAESIPGIMAIDLIPYHRLGLVKAKALGGKQKEYERLTDGQKETLLAALVKKTGMPCGWI